MGVGRRAHAFQIREHVAKGCRVQGFSGVLVEHCGGLWPREFNMEKIRATKASIRRRNRDVLDRVEERKKEALKKVAH